MLEKIDTKFVIGLMPKRPENSHKGTFGSVLNIAGSNRYIGAAYLSSISALKIGAGYVTLACPSEIVPVIASMAPEIVFCPLASNNSGSISCDNIIKNIQDYNVLSIGCGLTDCDDTKSFIFSILNKLSKVQKIVLDADGINILSNHKGEISLKNTVITPHPAELARLLNVSVDEIINNREKYARITSQTFECITVLKGHETIVTNGIKLYVNTTGSSALAKAGSGDTLTGIIAGLLAQKVSPLKAAVLGVYIHGRAGDIAASYLTKYSVLASDVINYIPKAVSEIITEE